MKVLLLDFAETLGHRQLPEIQTDFSLISKEIEEVPFSFEDYKNFQTNNNYYDKGLKFSDFDTEVEFSVGYLARFLEKYLSKKESAEKSARIVAKKFSQSAHSLYTDTISFLNNYKKTYRIFILSDGRPSRRKTLESLGLDRYCERMYVSDEVGYTKNQPEFYLFAGRFGKKPEIVYIDDQLKNLDALFSIRFFSGFYIDRKNSDPNYTGKYRRVTKLPLDI